MSPCPFPSAQGPQRPTARSASPTRRWSPRSEAWCSVRARPSGSSRSCPRKQVSSRTRGIRCALPLPQGPVSGSGFLVLGPGLPWVVPRRLAAPALTSCTECSWNTSACLSAELCPPPQVGLRESPADASASAAAGVGRLGGQELGPAGLWPELGLRKEGVCPSGFSLSGAYGHELPPGGAAGRVCSLNSWNRR